MATLNSFLRSGGGRLFDLSELWELTLPTHATWSPEGHACTAMSEAWTLANHALLPTRSTTGHKRWAAT
eukprot:349928-Chlamydomonas_euryale.AAC.2